MVQRLPCQDCVHGETVTAPHGTTVITLGPIEG